MARRKRDKPITLVKKRRKRRFLQDNGLASICTETGMTGTEYDHQKWDQKKQEHVETGKRYRSVDGKVHIQVTSCGGNILDLYGDEGDLDHTEKMIKSLHKDLEDVLSDISLMKEAKAAYLKGYPK